MADKKYSSSVVSRLQFISAFPAWFAQNQRTLVNQRSDTFTSQMFAGGRPRCHLLVRLGAENGIDQIRQARTSPEMDLFCIGEVKARQRERLCLRELFSSPLGGSPFSTLSIKI